MPFKWGLKRRKRSHRMAAMPQYIRPLCHHGCAAAGTVSSFWRVSDSLRDSAASVRSPSTSVLRMLVLSVAEPARVLDVSSTVVLELLSYRSVVLDSSRPEVSNRSVTVSPAPASVLSVFRPEFLSRIQISSWMERNCCRRLSVSFAAALASSRARVSWFRFLYTLQLTGYRASVRMRAGRYLFNRMGQPVHFPPERSHLLPERIHNQFHHRLDGLPVVVQLSRSDIRFHLVHFLFQPGHLLGRLGFHQEGC